MLILFSLIFICLGIVEKKNEREITDFRTILFILFSFFNFPHFFFENPLFPLLHPFILFNYNYSLFVYDFFPNNLFPKILFYFF